MRLRSLLCLCGLVCGSHAAAQEPTRDCSDPQTQTDMNICAFETWQRADAALNSAYVAAIAVAKARDTSREGLSMQRRVGHALDDISTEEALRRAQRAWITFRDHACLAESDIAFGGTLQPLLHSGCFTDLTLQRTTQLLSFAEAY